VGTLVLTDHIRLIEKLDDIMRPTKLVSSIRYTPYYNSFKMTKGLKRKIVRLGWCHVGSTCWWLWM